jgi:hypothetical protein
MQMWSIIAELEMQIISDNAAGAGPDLTVLVPAYSGLRTDRNVRV